MRMKWEGLRHRGKATEPAETPRPTRRALRPTSSGSWSNNTPTLRFRGGLRRAGVPEHLAKRSRSSLCSRIVLAIQPNADGTKDMHLGNLRGTGTLEWEGKTVPVGYDIAVTYHRHMLDGSGTLGHSEPLPGIFEADRIILRVDSGEEVRIHIENVGSRGTTFITSGVVPGEWEKRMPRH